MKGFFTQGVFVLFEQAPAVDDLVAALGEPLERSGAGTGPWIGSPDRLRYAGPDGQGQMMVEVIDQPWPDHLGDPESEPELFGAWTMGFLGTFTYPGSLGRAVQQSHLWAGAKEAVGRHRAIVRILITYVANAAEGDPVAPSGYDPVSELQWLTARWRSVLRIHGAICAFNPSGEVVVDAETFDRALVAAESAGIAPLDLWSNVRMWKAAEGWMVFETIGLDQLDHPDQEACVGEDAVPAGDVVLMLRNISWYLVSTDTVFEAGDTMDGPGGRWQALLADQALVTPPRATVRWFPMFGDRAPEALIPAPKVEFDFFE